MERREDTPVRSEMERIDELEARARALEQDLSYEERLRYEEEHRARKDARLAEGRGDAELDEAVDESFPASDPASPARSGDGVAHARAVSDELDEALDDTFPASDVPSMTTPRREGEPE